MEDEYDPRTPVDRSREASWVVNDVGRKQPQRSHGRQQASSPWSPCEFSPQEWLSLARLARTGARVEGCARIHNHFRRIRSRERRVFLVTTYKSGSIITSALKKHKMSCFGCCEENDNNRTVASGGPYVASHSAGNDGDYLSANTPSKGAQTIKPQPIAVPAIPVDKIREITKNFGDEALIWEGSFGRVYFGVLKNEKSTGVKKLYSSKQPDQEFLAQVSMVSRLKHENVVELVGYSVEGNLRLLAYEFATMGSLHDILHEVVRKEPTIEKPTPVSAPPKDAERQLSKKELKRKEMAKLDALLHEMVIANKDSNTAQNETADKKQLEQCSEGEKKESVGAPSENRILKKKKSKKENHQRNKKSMIKNRRKETLKLKWQMHLQLT
ncbi:hypothetical protein ZIOFF_069875 [Zingiber officinale]|uniref:Protein kinase domain-containing protein n=1 Tax=Zingiber officinale TaxID=94328 RepID=A0A8J5C6L6_ZINOF|nr:hypothetical protein ZIOFF_069875 [Zingiber officinale]